MASGHPAIAFAALVAALGGCWVPLSEGKTLDARLTRVERDRTDDQRRSDAEEAQLEQDLARLTQRVGAVEAQMGALAPLQAQLGGGLGREVGALEEQVRLLHGLVDAQQQHLGQIQGSVQALQSDVEARFAALGGTGALDEWEARKKVDGMKLPPDAEGMVDLGRDAETRGATAVAAEIYRRALRSFPTAQPAAVARFRLGEIHYSAGEYQAAVGDYRRLVEDYPRSDLAPDALCRAGEAFLALDLRGDALASFRDVLQRYPHSTAAVRARERIGGLAARQARGASSRN